MPSLRSNQSLLIILWQMYVAISAEVLNNVDNATIPELVSSTIAPAVCISPIDIIPANVRAEATIPFPEEVRDISVTLKKENSYINGMALRLSPVNKGEGTTLEMLVTALSANNTEPSARSANNTAPSVRSANDTAPSALSANTTAPSANFDASTPVDGLAFMHLCVENSSYCYLYSEIHWGATDESGSDHSVEGRRSPLEIQHFFLNSSYEGLGVLGISVRYRTTHQDNVVDPKDMHNGTQMADYLRSMKIDDALMRRKREANNETVVPGDSNTPTNEMRNVTGAEAENRTKEESVLTNVHVNDSNTTAASDNGSNLRESKELALNLSTTTITPDPVYNRTGLSYLSQEEFEAFLRGDIQEINVTLGDFLLPLGASYYQYRGNAIIECEKPVDWLLYVEEETVLPSVLHLLRQLQKAPNTSETQQTSKNQLQGTVDVFRWPYPDPSTWAHPQASGSGLLYFNPIIFLAMPIIILLEFFIL